MSEYRLEVRGVTKVFPGTRALDQVQLQVRPGEVHALCGENGAGKSTLMNIIGGVFPPTEGEILFEGAPIAPRNPKEAQDIGIGFVHQELSLCPHLTAAENIFIGRLPHKGGMIDFKRLWADADMVLKQFNANFPSSALVSELTVSEQQIIEIAKSVSLNCKLLILDEPTSSLTEKETARLFDLVKELSGRGISILYISHRMAEIFEICDRVTVFKDGTYVTTMDTGDICADDIIRATVCDFKNEYAYLAGCPGHFDHTHCMEGLRTFSEENERRIREGVTEADPFHVLLFSEWGMFCSVSDRRTREEAIALAAGLIMSVRAQKMTVWLDLQRPDSQFMGTARDSLAPIALGNLSPEGKRMAFPDFVNEIEPVGRGEGYFSDGTTIQKIIVPTITRWDVLHEDVRELVEQ